MRFYHMLEAQHTSPEAAFVYDLLTANLGMVQSGGAQFWDSLVEAYCLHCIPSLIFIPLQNVAVE